MTISGDCALEHQAARHDRRWAKAGFGASAFAKAALGVEIYGARIGGHHKSRCFEGGGELRRLLDQQAADAAAPQVRLDKEPIELGVAVSARQDDREARGRPPVLSDDDEAGGDLLFRKLDRVRMFE